MCICLYKSSKWSFPRKKINDEFRIVFKEEEFYLLDHILTVGEKEKVLLGLNLKIKKESIWEESGAK